MRPVSCPGTSVRNYHYSLRKNPEERSSHLLRGRSVKSRTDWHAFPLFLWLVNRFVLKSCNVLLTRYTLHHLMCNGRITFNVLESCDRKWRRIRKQF